jgi:uncharacterized protein YkwD
MSQTRKRLAATVTVLLATSLGPLAAPAGAGARASSSLISKRHGHALVHRHALVHSHAREQRHTGARRRTRGYRGAAPGGKYAPGASNAHRITAGSRRSAVAAVLATPCQNLELTPTTANLELVRAAVLCLVNTLRAHHDQAPLRLNQRLGQVAQEHGDELVARDYFAHVSPSGETPVDRIRGTGYIPGPNVGYVLGENLAWGTMSLATPRAIVAAWTASPGHLANILESQYTETGIGVTPQVPPSLAAGSPGATYTQEFGVIIH